MSEILKEYSRIKDIILPMLNGPLSPGVLNGLSKKIIDIIDVHLKNTTNEQQEKIVQEAKSYIPHAILKDSDLNASLILFGLAVDVLVKKYFMTITNAPGFKKIFWQEVQKSGVSYDIWLNLNKILSNYN